MTELVSTISIKPPIQFSYQLPTTLTNDNYLIWKSQIIPVLRGHGLIGFINNAQVLPPTTIPSTGGADISNPEYERWIQQDQLILAWMFGSISPSILAQVMHCDSTSALWHKLNQMYTTQSMAKTLELKLQLQTTQKGGLSCVQFMQQMQSIADKLRSVESEISDHELVLYTLQGLGSEFENFVTAVSMRPEPPSMIDLQSLLLAHEARIRASQRSVNSSTVHLTTQLNALSVNSDNSANQGGTMSDSTALYTNRTANYPNSQSLPSSNNSNRSYQTNRGRGYRGRGRGRSGSNSKDRDIQCQICFKWGHRAGKCYNRFNLQFSGDPPQEHQALVAEEPAV